MPEANSPAEILGRLAKTPEELPDLPENFVRAVHITQPEMAEMVALQGLDYQRHGMAQSTARAWSNLNEVEFGSTDRRFSFPGAKAVVFDIPAEEWRVHNDVARSPGRIPAEYVVGLVDAI